jgi:hypothetical protein
MKMNKELAGLILNEQIKKTQTNNLKSIMRDYLTFEKDSQLNAIKRILNNFYHLEG